MAQHGHNRIDEAMKKKLRLGISKIEKLKSEQREISVEISDIYKELKSVGYDTAALRELISKRAKRRRNPDKYQETEDALDVYMVAIGVED